MKKLLSIICKYIKVFTNVKTELAIIYNKDFEMLAKWSNGIESPVIVFSTDNKMSGVDVGYLYVNHRSIKAGFSVFIRNCELSADNINKAIKQIQNDLNEQVNIAYFNDGMKEKVMFANCNQIIKQFCEINGYYIKNYNTATEV